VKRRDWLINLTNTASIVARYYGEAEVRSILAKYDATSIDSLRPCFYSDAFWDLEDRAKQAKD